MICNKCWSRRVCPHIRNLGIGYRIYHMIRIWTVSCFILLCCGSVAGGALCLWGKRRRLWVIVLPGFEKFSFPKICLNRFQKTKRRIEAIYCHSGNLVQEILRFDLPSVIHRGVSTIEQYSKVKKSIEDNLYTSTCLYMLDYTTYIYVYLVYMYAWLYHMMRVLWRSIAHAYYEIWKVIIWAGVQYLFSVFCTSTWNLSFLGGTLSFCLLSKLIFACFDRGLYIDSYQVSSTSINYINFQV